MRKFACVLTVLVAFVTGCETDEPASPAAANSAGNDAANTVAKPVWEKEGQAAQGQAAAEKPPETVVEQAKPGMTGKGKYDPNSPAAIVTTPLGAYHRVKEALTLDLITHALNLYNALHGEYPQSHDEFMKEIIQANNIGLPKLPEGHEYWYDAATHTLMVKHPAE